MRRRFWASAVIKEIGNPALGLIHGFGNGGSYWYFTYSDEHRYETHSVMTARLTALPKEWWVKEGLRFIKHVECGVPLDD